MTGLPRTIMLIDDEQLIHDSVKSSLESCNFSLDHLLEFYDPITAIEALESSSDNQLPDVILLDVNFKTSALSGVDALTIIKESYPLIPVIMLTGMGTDVLEPVQEYDLVYYIAKPISGDQLCKSIDFYYNSSEKNARRIRELSNEIDAYEELIQEVNLSEATPENEGNTKKEKIEEKILDLFDTILTSFATTSSIKDDLTHVIRSDYNNAKRLINMIIALDRDSIPSQNIHKVKGTEDVYSARMTHKARLIYFSKGGIKKLLRLDVHHDTKGMDKWIKNNYDSFAE